MRDRQERLRPLGVRDARNAGARRRVSQADEKKDQRVHDEGDIGPKRLQGGFGLHAAILCTQIADNEARRCGRNDPRQAQLICKQITAVRDNSRQSDLNFGVINCSRESARGVAEEGAKYRSSEYCEEKLANPF